MDFEGDLYGEEVRVDFVARLRDVLPFDSVAALVDQMREDVGEARTILAADEAAAGP
jgi:riboflavin kinase/FMN adenylyltransferase